MHQHSIIGKAQYKQQFGLFTELLRNAPPLDYRKSQNFTKKAFWEDAKAKISHKI